jgi:hypothetical protein
MGLDFRKDKDARGKETLNNQADIRILARAHLEQMEILGRGKAALDIY